LPDRSSITNHVVVFSGGMDSFTLLHSVLRQEVTIPLDNIYALSFNYGQRHKRELSAAKIVCDRHGVSQHFISLAFLNDLSPISALTSDTPVPHGHYAAPSMKQTVVPGRNTIMLAAALAFAEGLDPDRPGIIYYGAHSGDHDIYPDCRPAYIEAMQAVVYTATEGRVILRAPFMDMTKGDILKHGLNIGLLAENYRNTWTCYAGGAVSCGKCGSCTERLLAFDEAGMIDPLEYQDRDSYKAQAKDDPTA
jgi:7-cyano-7-deazaguanine synthase